MMVGHMSIVPHLQIVSTKAIATTNMFIETSSLQYYDNTGDIYDDGIKLNELLLVSRITCSLLNKDNHVKVDTHMAPPVPFTSLSVSQPIPNLSNRK